MRIAVYDVKKLQIHRLSLFLLGMLAIIKVMLKCFSGDTDMRTSFIPIAGACILGGVLMLIHKLTHKQLGMGDIKLVVVLTVYKGMQYILLSLFYAFVMCSIVATMGMLLKQLTKKDNLPFAPFLVGGMVITAWL